ncbi:hypothetical protein IM538_18550 [Cytobacillus suaedae]|nr:hypothetical protein IM538_18550 [Cytobacillus suaedae]
MIQFIENERFTRVKGDRIRNIGVKLQKGDTYVVADAINRKIHLDKHFEGNMVFIVRMENLDTTELRSFLFVYNTQEQLMFVFRLHNFNIERAKFVYFRERGKPIASKEDTLLTQIKDILLFDSRNKKVYDTRKDSSEEVPLHIKHMTKISLSHRSTRKKLRNLYSVHTTRPFPNQKSIAFYPDAIIEHSVENHRKNVRCSYVELELSNHESFHDKDDFKVKLIRYTSKTNPVYFIVSDDLVDHHVELFTDYLYKRGNLKPPPWYIAPLSEFINRGVYSFELIKNHTSLFTKLIDMED